MHYLRMNSAINEQMDRAKGVLVITILKKMYILGEEVRLDYVFTRESISTVDELESDVNNCIDKIIASKSCKNAIKFNDIISRNDAELLLKNLAYCE